MKRIFNITPDNHIQHCFDLRRYNVLSKDSEWMGVKMVFDRQSDERLNRIGRVRKNINITTEVSFLAIICCIVLCVFNRILPFEGLLAAFLMFLFCSFAGLMIAGLICLCFQAVMDKMEEPILLEIFQNSEFFTRAQSYGFDVKINKGNCTPLTCGIKLPEIKKALEAEFQGISISAY